MHKKATNGWQYVTKRGVGRTKEMPRFGWTGTLRPDVVSPPSQVELQPAVHHCPACSRLSADLMQVMPAGPRQHRAAGVGDDRQHRRAGRHGTEEQAAASKCDISMRGGASCHCSLARLGSPTWTQLERVVARAVISRTPKEIEGMRVVCRMGREILDAAHAAIRPGATTDDIDRVVRWQAVSCAFIWTTLPQHHGTPSWSLVGCRYMRRHCPGEHTLRH